MLSGLQDLSVQISDPTCRQTSKGGEAPVQMVGNWTNGFISLDLAVKLLEEHFHSHIVVQL